MNNFLKIVAVFSADIFFVILTQIAIYAFLRYTDIQIFIATNNTIFDVHVHQMHVQHFIYCFIYCDSHKQFVLGTFVFRNSVKAMSQLFVH